MSKLNDHLPLSPDHNAERLGELKRLFPDLFTNEGQLDPDELKKLTNPTELGTEKFRFTWYGKSRAKRKAFSPSKGALVYDEARSVNPDKADGNMIIEGENLEVLKLLTSAYRDSVKCIYIDPPYNTGSDFIYPDNYTQGQKEYWEQNGTYKDGVRMDTNSDSSGRFHSDWLSMMYSRLLVARLLLKEDGVIFVSIGDEEIHRLKMLMDEVFGEENFVAQFTWSGGRKNDSKLVSVSHDYILCYVKLIDIYKEKNIRWRTRKEGIDDIYNKYRSLKRKHRNDYRRIEKELKKWFAELPNSDPAKRHRHYSSVDERGIYFPSDISWPGGGGPKYEVLHPVTGKPCKIPSRGWMYSDPNRMQEMIADNRIHFGEDENAVPCVKSYLKDREDEVPYSVFYQDGRASTKRLRSLMGGDFLEHPKDERILQKIIEFTTGDGDIVLDFFAGSGTIAQSVIEQNDQDGSHRRFMLVQIPEAIDPNKSPVSKSAVREGYKKISDITIERAKRVVEGYGDNPQPLDTGFKVYRLARSRFPRIEFQPDPDKSEDENVEALKQYIREKENSFQMVFERDEVFEEVLLKQGFKLTYTLERQNQFGGENDVFLASDGKREALICLDPVLEESTVDYFKTNRDQFFICLERALDTTKKWNLKHYLGERLKAV